MIFSMTSDYFQGTGNPEPYLARIAQAGFTHIHWCHQWNTDFLYTEPEIAHIESVFSANGLRLLNLHASAGVEKNPASEREHERRAGVELVRNRLEMTARLGAEVLILHAPQTYSEIFRRSLDELEREFRACRVRLALENTGDNFVLLQGYLADYAPDFLGMCYDCGHGNMAGRKIPAAELERVRDRIYAYHLHDNDGESDLHRIPFSGTVDWALVARLIAGSPCRDSINLENNMRTYGAFDEMEYLRQSMAASRRLGEMVQAETARR